MILIICILISISYSQRQLRVELQNLDGTVSGSSITIGYYSKQVMVRPADGGVFQSEFIVSSNQKLFPAFPKSKLGQSSLTFRVAAAAVGSGALQFTINPSTDYQNPGAITISGSSSVCQITPYVDYSTIVFQERRNIILDLAPCLPVDPLQVQANYGNIQRTLTLTERKLVFDILAGSTTVGSTIQVTFTTTNPFYAISAANLQVVNKETTTPNALVTRSGTECASAQENIALSCSIRSLLYYAYFYKQEPSLNTIIQKTGLLRIPQLADGSEGYGFLKADDTSTKSVSLTNLKSNTLYRVVVYCVSEFGIQSAPAYLTFLRCNSQLVVNSLEIVTKNVYSKNQLSRMACSFMLQQRLAPQQISTPEGLYCDNITQWKYSSSFGDFTQAAQDIRYTFLVYPLYTETAPKIYSASSFSGVTTVATYQQSLPSIKQEFLAGAKPFLNFTIQLNENGFIYVGLDGINVKTPTVYQLIQGVNGNGQLLVQWYKTNLTAKNQQKFVFQVSDNIPYQLYFAIGQDASPGTLLGAVQTRQFSLQRINQSSSILTKAFALLIVLLLS